jgi:hypothetical protein
MFAIAWVDTPDGRRWAAVRSAVLLVVGAIFWSIGRSVSEQLMAWLGRGLVLFGAVGVVWAYLHSSRGLPPPPLSAACASNRHADCSDDHMCACPCHRREANATTHLR